MNGAVQGAATATASTPVKKAPTVPPWPASATLPAAACTLPPISNRPARLSATSSMTRVSTAITTGDCSWNPQPTA